MANTKSAKKAIRVSARKRNINLARAKKVKAAIKDVRNFEGTKTESLVLNSKLQKELDKAVKKGFLHKNTANRMKSKASKNLKSQVS